MSCWEESRRRVIDELAGAASAEGEVAHKGREGMKTMVWPSLAALRRSGWLHFQRGGAALALESWSAERAADCSPAGARLGGRVLHSSCEQGKQFRRLLDFSLRVRGSC